MSNTAIAKVNKKEIVNTVQNKVQDMVEQNQLNLPITYSVGNAMNAAWLVLQEVEDRNKNKALDVCTNASISNALLNMAVQGLSPIKNQCYFIVYGKTLQMQRSYLGAMAVAKRVPGVEDIIARVIYKGDDFVPVVEDGVLKIKKHEISWKNMNGGEVEGAYCIVKHSDGKEDYVDIMTMEQIKQAWKQSKMKPINDNGTIKSGSTHSKFTEEMAKKTIINRACKKIINSSDDSNVLVYQQVETEAEEFIVHEEIEENANSVEFSIKEVDSSEITGDTIVPRDIVTTGSIKSDIEFGGEITGSHSDMQVVDAIPGVDFDPKTGEYIVDKSDPKSNNSQEKTPTKIQKKTEKKQEPVKQKEPSLFPKKDDDCPFG